MTDTHALPQELQSEIAHLHQLTGVEPEVVELRQRRWRVIMRNERVYMEMDVQGRGVALDSCDWLRSTLLVDGQRRPLARSCEHFARIFLDPDTKGAPRGQADELLPEADPSTAPAAVRHMFARIAQGLGAERVRLGSDGSRWTLSVTTDTADLRLRFKRQGRRTLAAKRFIQLIVDGRDYSRQVGDSLEEALAMLAAPATGPAAPGTVGAPADGAGYGAVGVRRHSVIRN